MGETPDVRGVVSAHDAGMRIYLLDHSHEESQCDAAFAAWAGVRSELRGSTALAGCAQGEHRVIWRVEADDAQAALALLPGFIAAQTVVVPVREVVIP